MLYFLIDFLIALFRVELSACKHNQLLRYRKILCTFQYMLQIRWCPSQSFLTSPSFPIHWFSSKVTLLKETNICKAMIILGYHFTLRFLCFLRKQLLKVISMYFSSFLKMWRLRLNFYNESLSIFVMQVYVYLVLKLKVLMFLWSFLLN